MQVFAIHLVLIVLLVVIADFNADAQHHAFSHPAFLFFFKKIFPKNNFQLFHSGVVVGHPTHVMQV